MILHLSAMGRHQLKLQHKGAPSELAEFTELSSDIKIQQERLGVMHNMCFTECMDLADHNGRGNKRIFGEE